MSTNEIMVECNGALLHIKSYSKEFYITTINICRFGIVHGAYYWTIQIDLANSRIENFGAYEEYDTAYSDLLELLSLIYGEKHSQI